MHISDKYLFIKSGSLMDVRKCVILAGKPFIITVRLYLARSGPYQPTQRSFYYV